MSSTSPTELREFVHTILEPCLAEDPIAGAVLLIAGDEGAAFTLINMTSLEAIYILRYAAKRIEDNLGESPEIMQ